MLKRILVVGAGWEQVPLVERARAEGYRVLVTSGDPRSEAFRSANAHEVIDSRDLGSLLRFARSSKIDAVVSDQCDYSRYAQAWLSEALGLPGPKLGAVAITTNKKWLRELCRKHGIPQPPYEVCRSFSEVEAAARAIGFPVIVKPVDNRGSFGVTRVDDSAGLRPAWSEAVSNAHSREVLVERFIAGTVVTVDGIHAREGHCVLGVATKTQVGGARQVAMEIVYPGEFDDATHALARKRADAVAAALRTAGGTGPTHTEFIFDGSDFILVESANRGGGVFTANTILPAHSGFDHNGELIAEATGDRFAAPPVPAQRPAVILKFLELASGLVESVGDLALALNAPGVLKGRLLVKSGDSVGPIQNAGHRGGFLIVEGRDVAEARYRFREAVAKLEIVYAEGPA